MKSSILLSALVGAVFSSVPLEAAPINWSTPVNIITGDAVVSTNGDLIEGMNIQDAASPTRNFVVNGVNFFGAKPIGTSAYTSSIGFFTVSGMDRDGHSDYSPVGGNIGDWGTLSDDLKGILKEAQWSSSSNFTVTLNNLVPGAEYEVQLFVNDSRDTWAEGYHTEFSDSEGTKSGAVDFNTQTGAAVNGGVGQAIAGTFTADDSRTYTITVGQPNRQLNAIQLRQLSGGSGGGSNTEGSVAGEPEFARGEPTALFAFDAGSLINTQETLPTGVTAVNNLTLSTSAQSAVVTETGFEDTLRFAADEVTSESGDRYLELTIEFANEAEFSGASIRFEHEQSVTTTGNISTFEIFKVNADASLKSLGSSTVSGNATTPYTSTTDVFSLTTPHGDNATLRIRIVPTDLLDAPGTNFGLAWLTVALQRPVAHPRLFVQAEDLPALKARYNSPKTAQLRTWLSLQANTTNDGVSNDGYGHASIWKAMEAKAFQYLVNDDAVAGFYAKKMAIEYFESLTYNYFEDSSSSNIYRSRDLSRSILGAAMVYDWCYDLFTPTEREDFIAEVLRVAGNCEYSWPISTDSFSYHQYVSSHWAEEKHPNMLAFGIACYSEDPSVYDSMAEHLYEHFVPLRNFYYQGHKHPQGSAYGVGRFISEMMTTALITGMGDPNPYHVDQQQLYYYNMYSRRPDGYVLPEHDDFSIDWEPNTHHGILGVMIAATQYQDPYLQGEVERYWNSLQRFDEDAAALLYVLYDETLEAKDYDDLPLSRYFGSPAGNMIARTGWDIEGGAESEVVVAKMDVNEYNLSGHVHADAGHFSIYHRGPLAIDSGAYAASPEGSKYGASHHRNYYFRTVAHNSLLINDPNQPQGWGLNDGGQAVMQGYDTIEERETIARRAHVLAQGFGPDPITPDYTYLKGDLTPAYRSQDLDYPNKAREVKRSFVFLNHFDTTNPATMIVYDRVISSDPSFKKTWLLHSEEEPVVNGQTTVIQRTTGRDDYDGKLVNTTLLPAADDTDITVIGGPGHEFEASGTNWPLLSDDLIDRYEAGRWRIELSPKTAKDEDTFLNVIQVMGASDDSDARAITPIESAEYVGAALADRAVLFSRSGQPQTRNFTVKIPQLTVSIPEAPPTMKVLITDLEEGFWVVSGPNTEQAHIVTAEAGTLYFSGPAGTYTVKAEQTARLDNVFQELGTSVTVDYPVDPTQLGLAYQWFKDGGAIEGATSNVLSIPDLQADEVGLYHLQMTVEGTSTTSNPFWIGPRPEHSFIVNASVRSKTRPGDQTLVFGTVLSPIGHRELIMRSAGPALLDFGVEGALVNPNLTVYEGADAIDHNDNWQDAPNLTALEEASGQAGAYAFADGSSDAALLIELGGGAYTAHAGGATDENGGVTLIELFGSAQNADDLLTYSQLVNTSTRTQVGTGEDVLIQGFVIVGDAPKRLLVRAGGPALEQFGLTGVLEDPNLQVFLDDQVVSENNDWGTVDGLVDVFAEAGAYAFPDGSKDAALVVDLQPGAYTAVVSGADNGTGIALVELYDLD